MSKKHQKHAKLTKPNIGNFGRNELAILGTPCGEIKRLARDISEKIGSQNNIAYVDADHKSSDDKSNLEGSALNHDVKLEYTDKIDFHRYDFQGKLNDFQTKSIFNEQDLVIVNGNHFLAKAQIVVIDERKSLEKKLDKLTNVVLFILNGSEEIPKYLVDHVNNDQIPIIAIDNIEAICQFISTYVNQYSPKIKGLVLSGGKSVRMKKDKTKIEYHGKFQRDHMFDLLTSITEKAHYSIRPDQEVDFDSSYSIKDRFLGLGPYGAILSAMMSDPNSAWLVTAADQPFLNKATLELLVAKRNSSKVATCFYNPETDFPEPLVTLWEPRAYPILLQYLSQGYSCPRKVLINSDIEMIKLNDSSVLKNVNTPEEFEEAKKLLIS